MTTETPRLKKKRTNKKKRLNLNRIFQFWLVQQCNEPFHDPGAMRFLYEMQAFEING